MSSRIMGVVEAKGPCTPAVGHIVGPACAAGSAWSAGSRSSAASTSRRKSWHIVPEKPLQLWGTAGPPSWASFILLPTTQGPPPPDDKQLEPPLEGVPPDLFDLSDRRFRFWVDDAALFGRRLHCHGDLLDRVWQEAGGVRTGGPPPQGFMEQVDPQVLGYNNMNMWDLLWSSPKNCLVASLRLRHGQVVNAVPGLLKLTVKRDMLACLRTAFGQAAFSITPVSFLLPEDISEWRSYAATPMVTDTVDRGWWMLKQERSKGKGVRLCTCDEAEHILEQQRSQHSSGRPYSVVQQYITRPLLIAGRKWHIRSWLLVTCVNPLAAYMHRRGLVYFTDEPYRPLPTLNPASQISDPQGSSTWDELSASHLTNHFQNPKGAVWSLHQLSQHLGGASWQAVWRQMQSAGACLVASGLKHMQQQRRQVGLTAGNDFQLLGLDFLVDSSLKVWLLEANATPALDSDHDLPDASTTMHQQKSEMLRDMCRIIRLRFRDQISSDIRRASSMVRSAMSSRTEAQDGLALVCRELDHCGGFEPLMGWFPLGDDGGTTAGSVDKRVHSSVAGLAGSIQVPWQSSDAALRQLHFSSAQSC